MNDDRAIKQYHQLTSDSSEVVFMDKLHAASSWQRYVPGRVDVPELGEWCLWSAIIDGSREYGCGSLQGETLLFIIQGIGRFIRIDDIFSCYFAHINRMAFNE